MFAYFGFCILGMVLLAFLGSSSVCLSWLLHSRHGPFGVSVMLRIDELNTSMSRFLALACWDLLATRKRAHEIGTKRRSKKGHEGISVP